MTNPRRTLAGALALCGLIAGGALLAVLSSPGDEARSLVHEESAQPGVASRAADLEGAVDEGERVVTQRQEPGELEHTESDRSVAAGARGSVTGEPLRWAAHDPRPPSILVRVTSSDGTTLSGRRVLVGAREAGEARTVTLKGTPLGDGLFALRLSPGMWSVQADAAAHEASEPREVLVTEGDTTAELDVVLQARPSVRIVVRTPEGAPFPDRHAGKPVKLHAIATREAPERSLHEVTTAETQLACSTFHPRTDVRPSDPTCLGLLELRCDPPLSVSVAVGLDVLETRPLERLVEELVFVVDPAAVAERVPLLTFRVVDDTTGAPLEKARPHLALGLWSDVVIRGHEGRFAHAVPAGPTTLEVFAAGYVKVTRELDVPRAPRFDLGTIPMRRETTGEIILELARPAGLDPLELSWSPLAEWVEGREPQIQFGRRVKSDETRIDLPLGAWVLRGDTWLGLVRHGTVLRVLEVEPGSRRVALQVEPFADVVLRSVDRRRTVVVTDAKYGLVVAGPHAWGPGNLTIELLPGIYRAASEPDGGMRPVEFVVTAQGATVDLP